MISRYRVSCLLLFLLLAPVATGCKKEQPYGSVEGTVTLDGKPLTKAEVVFLPDPDKGSSGPRSTAFTDEEGRYRLATDKGRTGAPLGLHRVCINDLLAASKGPVPGLPSEDSDTKGVAGFQPPVPGGAGTPKGRFSADYSNSFKTPFRDIEVKEGSQVIDLPLKSTGPR